MLLQFIKIIRKLGVSIKQDMGQSTAKIPRGHSTGCHGPAGIRTLKHIPKDPRGFRRKWWTQNAITNQVGLIFKWCKSWWHCSSAEKDNLYTSKPGLFFFRCNSPIMSIINLHRRRKAPMAQLRRISKALGIHSTHQSLLQMSVPTDQYFRRGPKTHFVCNKNSKKTR